MPITQYARDHASELQINLGRLEFLDATLDRWINQEKVRQGLVFRLNRYGQTVFEGRYGGNLNTGEPPDYDTIFPVASITKPVVAVMIMKLQEDGLVDVAEPVSAYLPEFTGGGKEKICVWHLLSHVSGIDGEDIGEYLDANRAELGLTDDSPWPEILKAVLTQMPLKREPCTKMSYLGAGYEMLKWIIEKVSGESIDQYAAKTIFAPLCMVNSHFVLPESKWKQAMGWDEQCEGYPRIVSPKTYTDTSGNGGLKTTVADMCRFLDMVLSGGTLDGARVLCKASIIAMLSNQNIGMGEYDSWGLGWNVRGTKKDDTGVLRSALAFDHGGWPGSKVLADPQHGISVAYFSARYTHKPFNMHPRVTNIIYSALD